MDVHLIRRANAGDPEDRVRARVHQCDERIHHPVEEVQRVRAPERESERTLYRKVLGGELADDDVQVGDDAERQREGDDLEKRRGQPCEHRREQCRDRRLTDPADSERAKRHAQLGRRYVLIELIDNARREASTGAALLGELVELGFSDPDKRVFGRDEEPVRQNEQHREAKSGERARVHERAILAPRLGS